MMELMGTQKQIEWATQIRETLVNSVNDTTVPQVHHLFTSNTAAAKRFISELQGLQTSNAYLNNQIVIAKIRQLIENESDAKVFIDNQSLLSFLKVALSK